MKIFLTITCFLVSFSFSFSQSYSSGYNQGYKDGYCHRDIGCVAPPATPGIPSPGANDYNHGYQDGFAKGVKDKAVKKSSPSYSTNRTAMKQPNQSTYIDYNKMSKDLANQIYQVGQNIEMKRAAAYNYYNKCLSFVSEYNCNGEIFSFNQLVFNIQTETKKQINTIYDYLTSGWLELEDFYFGLNTLMNNYVAIINKCNQINESIVSKLNQYLKSNDIEGYKEFLDDAEIEFDDLVVNYFISWFQKTRRYQNISGQEYLLSSIKPGQGYKYKESEFFSKSISFIKNHKTKKPTIIKLEPESKPNIQSKYQDNCKSPSPLPVEITETVAKCDSLYVKGLYSECIALYTSLIEKYPEYCIAYYNRGLARYYSGYINLAKADFEKAISLGFEEAEEFIKNRDGIFNMKSPSGN